MKEIQTLLTSAYSRLRRNKSKTNLLTWTILVGLFSSILISGALIQNQNFLNVSALQSPFPVQNAIVEASNGNGIGDGSALSNAQGFYNITTFLDAGNYSVSASATGYIDTVINNITVVAGQETKNVNITMPVSGGVMGTVTDAVTGLPISGTGVVAYNSTGSSNFGGFTNSSGNYLINTNLQTGTYIVGTYYAPGYISKNITGVSVTTGSITSNVNIALSRSGIITGTVRDAVTNAPLSGIFVTEVSSTGDSTAFSTTNSSGMYLLNTDLTTGVYNVTVYFPTNYLSTTVSGVAVTAGSTTTQNLALNPSGVITGTITNTLNGQPVSGVSVSATSGNFFGFATTDNNGKYNITSGLGTGTYQVFAFYGVSFNQTTAVVTAGQTTANVNLQVTAQPSGTITGQVKDSHGNPLSDASVSAQSLTNSGSTTTDSNGNYIINTGLSTGVYNVTASLTGYTTQTQTGVAVTVNQVTPNINFVLTAIPSGRISGYVFATTQQPGNTPTPTATNTPTPSANATSTPNATATPTPSSTPNATATPTPTPTPNGTATPSPTPTPTSTPTPTPKPTSAPINTKMPLSASAFTTVTVIRGQSWYFFVQALGGVWPYKIQWYENGAAVAGQSDTVLIITKAATGTFTYYCTVTDSAGTVVTTNTVTLTVV
ncbi:MAG TPA: carboxypeptidase-like regulatory domain-containing protein [Candidatus Nanoarchaeia archaeon]|nr:carboxypeptidase-like regulatory domain-containing protein [Candidatus Nanoarchaeia archaeon]